jgi:hypothetical protein
MEVKPPRTPAAKKLPAQSRIAQRNLLMKLRYIAALAILGAVLIGAAPAPVSLATVSIAPVTLAPNERIISVACIIRPVRVVTIRDVPAEWHASITNSGQGFAAVSAQAILPAAGFASGSPDLFTNFITIEKSRVPRPLQVHVTIKIAALAKPAAPRYVNYVLKDLKITPLVSAAAPAAR